MLGLETRAHLVDVGHLLIFFRWHFLIIMLFTFRRILFGTGLWRIICYYVICIVIVHIDDIDLIEFLASIQLLGVFIEIDYYGVTFKDVCALLQRWVFILFLFVWQYTIYLTVQQFILVHFVIIVDFLVILMTLLRLALYFLIKNNIKVFIDV